MKYLKEEKYFNQNKIINDTNIQTIKSVLDIGCGNCRLFDLLKQENENIILIGIDIEKQSTKHRILKPEELNTIKQDFDIVFMSETIEHLTNKQIENYFSFINKHLKKTGKLIITTPNIKNINTLTTFWEEYDHIKPYTANAIQQLLEKNTSLKISKIEKTQPIKSPTKIILSKLLGLDQQAGLYITVKHK